MALSSRSELAEPVSILPEDLNEGRAPGPPSPAASRAPAGAVRRWTRAVWLEIRRARVVLAATLLYWGVTALLGSVGTPVLTVYLRLLPVVILGELVLFRFPARLYDHMVRQGRPTGAAVRAAVREAGRAALGPGRVTAVAIGVLIVATTYGVYGAWKPRILEIGDYARWDRVFDHLDVWLHGGTRPWVYLHALPFRDTLTGILDVNYHLWFPILGATIAAHVLARDPWIRLRFLLAMVMLWAIAGTALATVFASSGPPYMATFVPGTEHVYAPLLAYLDQVGTAARTVQVSLWELTTGPEPPVFTGFSAMPSMHVVGSALVALAVTRTRIGVLSWLAWAHLVLTLVGSVHLGWHYAVDGYAAIPIAVAAWWLAGKVMEHEKRREAEAAGSPVVDRSRSVARRTAAV